MEEARVEGCRQRNERQRCLQEERKLTVANKMKANNARKEIKREIEESDERLEKQNEN